MRTHRFGRKIKLRDNRHQTSDQNAGMALYDVEKSELKDLADTIITSSTPSVLGSSAMVSSRMLSNAGRARRSCGRSPYLTSDLVMPIKTGTPHAFMGGSSLTSLFGGALSK